ncbi:hypothetical protein [Microcoleus sp. bin38.metabat.b11b12b14.051]|uniref:hypothetical protein n=1 Tax=Microcoleus sp. bin38.metabat.b11b12b14.051 TaxID=2742709 RepID=UPI0025F2D935|nr:hypothetical protein [Microcoleus sp. bin38.metabat.b11b12b14.051]
MKKNYAVFLSCILAMTVFFTGGIALAASSGDYRVSFAVPDDITETIYITGGKFTVDLKAIPVPNNLTVRSAVVTLPAREIGILNSISIIGPDGSSEFGCVNTRVRNGTDLIKACGGPAVLKAGNTQYTAEGSDFRPNPDVPFSITLSPDFPD